MPRQTASHIDSADEVGRRLRQTRTARGLRLTDVSFAGCSVGYLSHLERGVRVPSLQVLRELANRLEVSEEWLATGVGGREPVHKPRPEHAELDAAEAALRFDDLETAARLYGRLADSTAETAVRARARAGLGQLAFRHDNAEAALTELEAALELDPDLKDDDAFVDTLGRVYAHVGDVAAAVALFRRRLDRAKQAEDTVSAMRFSVLLANGLIDLSSFSEAAQVLSDILARTSSNDPVLLARLYWSQSRLHAMKDESTLAARYATKALQLLEATEFTQFRSRAHHLLAYIEIDRGNHDHALELIQAGRELGGGSPFDAARFDLEEARARIGLRQIDEAGPLIARAAGELSHHHPIDLGRCYAELAAISDQDGSPERARELYELALEYLEHAPNRWLVNTYTRFAELLERMSDRGAAFEVYKKAALAASALDQAPTASNA